MLHDRVHWLGTYLGTHVKSGTVNLTLGIEFCY